MSIETMLTRRELPLSWADYKAWPKVEVNAIKKKHRRRFENLQRVAKLMCKGEESLRSAATTVGMPHTTLQHVIGRALQIHKDGRINGERAFVKFAVRRNYMPSGKPVNGTAGQFKLLKKQHPKIKKIVKKCAFKGVSVDLHSKVTH